MDLTVLGIYMFSQIYASANINKKEVMNLKEIRKKFSMWEGFEEGEGRKKYN